MGNRDDMEGRGEAAGVLFPDGVAGGFMGQVGAQYGEANRGNTMAAVGVAEATAGATRAYDSPPTARWCLARSSSHVRKPCAEAPAALSRRRALELGRGFARAWSRLRLWNWQMCEGALVVFSG